jgi:hypothetical protein
VPTNDPMTLNNNNASRAKTNLYRQGVDQPPVAGGQSGTAYCRNLVNVGQKRTQLDKNLTMGGMSPDAAMANNLFTFLANRLAASFTNLGCQNLLHMKDPVTVQLDGNGVAVGATFAAATAPVGMCGPTTPTQPTTTAATPTATTTTADGGPTSTTQDPTATTTSANTTTDPNAPTTTTTPTATDPNAPTTAQPPTTTTDTCTPMPSTTQPPTTTPNGDYWASHHARHHPHKY